MMRILLFCLISFNLWANYAPVSEIDIQTVSKVYLHKKDCPAPCLKIPSGYNSAYHRKAEILVDDVANPNYAAPSNVVDCTVIVDDPESVGTDESLLSQADFCQYWNAKYQANNTCPDILVKLANNTQVYCTSIVSYPQIGSGQFHVVEDAGLKSTYDTAQAAAKSDEAALQAVVRLQACGARVKARMLIQNAPKALSNGQKKQLVTTYSDIIALLDAGSLDAARAEIQAVVPDGTLVTAGDKDALVTELDKCNI